MSGSDFMRFLPRTASVTLEELAREQGVRPVGSLAEMRADLWESDQELDEFLAGVRRARQEDLA